MSNDDDSQYDLDNDPGWLTDAAHAAHTLHMATVRVDPVTVATGSVLGFDAEQAQAILDDPHLTHLLLKHWDSHGSPSSIIEEIASGNDARGRLHRELLATRDAHLVTTTAPADEVPIAASNVVNMFGRRSAVSHSRPTLALAASTDSEGANRRRELAYDDVDATVRLQLTEDDRTLFEVTAAADASEAPQVAWIRYRNNDSTDEHDAFILLTQSADHADQFTGDLLVPDNHLNAEYTQFTIIDAAAIPAGLSDALSSAVAQSPTQTRNAWRSVARALPEGDALRQAIVAGLRR